MAHEEFDGYDRVSEVVGYLKAPNYIDWIEKTEKRDRTQIIKKAMKIGTRIDEIVKAVDTPVAKDCEEVKYCFEGFQRWKENYNPPLLTGERLFNEDLGITGEPDFYINNEEIMDLKASKKIYESYWLQLGGYLLLPHGRDIKRVSILRVFKGDGEYEYKVRDNLDELKALFISALNLYRYYKGEENGNSK